MDEQMTRDKLAIHGGPKTIADPMPARGQFGPDALDMVKAVFESALQKSRDFGYQGEFEDRYTDAFRRFMGGGYADGVSSGTAAVLVSLSALELPAGSEVLVSPVTDPGGVSPVVFARHGPKVVDAAEGSFNIGPDELARAISPRSRAVIVTHVGGVPADMAGITAVAEAHGIAVIEDCSQAHGATIAGRPVGTFGEIAAFSTMFGKAHSTGGCGGVVYTRDESLYWRARSLADRGKPFHRRDFDAKDPSTFLFPALNFNLDELSAAIGCHTLERLPETIRRRREIAGMWTDALSQNPVLRGLPVAPSLAPSPFFYTVVFRDPVSLETKQRFTEALIAEGVWLNPHYRFAVSEWDWLAPYLTEPARTPNACALRDRSFNLLFHEGFTDASVAKTVQAIDKVTTNLPI